MKEAVDFVYIWMMIEHVSQIETAVEDDESRYDRLSHGSPLIGRDDFTADQFKITYFAGTMWFLSQCRLKLIGN